MVSLWSGGSPVWGTCGGHQAARGRRRQVRGQKVQRQHITDRLSWVWFSGGAPCWGAHNWLPPCPWFIWTRPLTSSSGTTYIKFWAIRMIHQKFRNNKIKWYITPPFAPTLLPRNHLKNGIKIAADCLPNPPPPPPPPPYFFLSNTSSIK